MLFSLRHKLSISYVLLGLICVFLTMIATNYFFNKQFKEYVIKDQEQKNKELVLSISQQYSTVNGWNTGKIENIGINAITAGLIVKVFDKNNVILWDATVHNNGECKLILEKMGHNLHSTYPNIEGDYTEKNYPIIIDSDTVGKIIIGYYGPFYLTDNDILFIKNLNKIFIGIALISLVIALLLGAFMADRISSPISKVIIASKKISEGNYKDKITPASNTLEILKLTDTINNLAYTLDEQEQLRRRLTGDVAHELRTPLSTLQSHLEAMIDGIWLPTEERLVSCHEEILRINRMVGDIEKLSSYESGNAILDKSEFDVNEVICKTIYNFESEFQNKGIALVYNLQSYLGCDEQSYLRNNGQPKLDGHIQPELIYADKDKITQVIINLLSNSLKYTHKGGKVSITLIGLEKEIKIIIKDNGEGISEVDLPYIFERFYRADKSRNRMTGGSGIGLTITKSIIDVHSGCISIASKVGDGTDVCVTLPRLTPL